MNRRIPLLAACLVVVTLTPRLAAAEWAGPEAAVLTGVSPAMMAAAAEAMRLPAIDGMTDPGAATAPPTGVPTKATTLTTSHRNQVGIRLHAGTGFEFFVRYNATPNELCATSTCARRSGVFADAEITFAPASAIEIVVGARWIIERNGLREWEVQIRPGLIVYLEDSSDFKPFLIVQLIIEPINKFNIGGALGFGLQYDFARFVGMFLQIQANFVGIGYARLNMDASLGLQVRFP